MSGYLLDTNVVSELTKDLPEPGVVSFLSTQEDLWLSAIVLHELQYGIELLPQGRRRQTLLEAFAAYVAQFDERILPVGRAEAQSAASLRASARSAGRVLHLGDALIAGTALSNGLGLITRNAADFFGLGLEIVNPWYQPGHSA